MWIFLVGPMGAGKSTLCELAASQLPQCVFCDIDRLAMSRSRSLGWIHDDGIPDLHQRHFSGDWDRFFQFGMDLVGEVAAGNMGKHVVIAMGAAFQAPEGAQKLSKEHVVINITANPTIAYRRYNTRPGCYEQDKYYASEFKQSCRMRVYESAQHIIDSTRQSKEQTVDSLVGLLRSILQLS